MLPPSLRRGAFGAEKLQVHAEHTRGAAPAARCVPAPEGLTPGDMLKGPPLWVRHLLPHTETPKPLLHGVQMCLYGLRLTPLSLRSTEKRPEQGSCFRGRINVCAINDR